MLNCNLFLWSKQYFQHHFSSLQCHMIFRNHSNMLICCSRNISDYIFKQKIVILHCKIVSSITDEFSSVRKPLNSHLKYPILEMFLCNCSNNTASIYTDLSLMIVFPEEKHTQADSMLWLSLYCCRRVLITVTAMFGHFSRDQQHFSTRELVKHIQIYL